MNTVEVIEIIKKEHKIILSQLEILQSIPSRENIDVLHSTINKLGEIYDFWNKHEQKEEKFFKTLSSDFPVEKMEIDHREIRGHWKVLLIAVESKDNKKIQLALEIDGKMFENKLKEHMYREEKFFDEYLSIRK